MQKHILNFSKTLGILITEFIVGYLFALMGFTELHIFTIYVLGIVITAIVTASNLCSILSVCGIFIFNYFFAEPLLSFDAYHMGYPLTFVILLIAALLLGTLARKSDDRAKKLAQTAYRTQVLLETSQLLQKAKCKQDIVVVTANRLMRILGKNILVFTEEDGKISDAQVFTKKEEPLSFSVTQKELDTVFWTFHHGTCAGAKTEVFEYVKGTYMPIQTAERTYGVIGIDLNGGEFMADEANLVIGECALAFEREYYNHIREEAAVQAKNEKLRSNLLRSISHDLRTPLTGISGNAALLSNQGEKMTEEKRKELSKNIWKDATWLISMIENLLAITKLDEVEKNIVMRPELLEDILTESIHYAKSRYTEHSFILEQSDEMQLVQCNAQLISQVMRNLLENAVKYTKEGTKITVRTREQGEMIVVEVEDEGDGVQDDRKEKIFEMFYTSEAQASDKRRGFGIGLALCKAIVEAHGGKIAVRDARPHGAVFSFMIKKARLLRQNEEKFTNC